MGFINTSNSTLFIDDLKVVAPIEEKNNNEYKLNIPFNADQYSIKMFDYMLF